MRQQARRYSCSKENSKHPHIQATEKAGNEITNRHRNNPFSRHLSIALQPNKIHLHSNGWEAFEFLSVFHNFQRYKIAQRLRNVEVIHKEERNSTHNHLFPAHFQTFYKFFRHGSDALPPWLPTTSKPESTHTHTKVLLEPLESRWQGSFFLGINFSSSVAAAYRDVWRGFRACSAWERVSPAWRWVVLRTLP